MTATAGTPSVPHIQATPSQEQNWHYRRICYRWIVDLTLSTDEDVSQFKACFNEDQFSDMAACLRYLQAQELAAELEPFGLYRDIGVMIVPTHES